MSEYYRRHNRARRDDPSNGQSSVLGSIFRVLFFLVLAVVVLSGGLWILGATIGLVFGLVTLAITLAPILITAWIVWVIFKALVF